MHRARSPRVTRVFVFTSARHAHKIFLRREPRRVSAFARRVASKSPATDRRAGFQTVPRGFGARPRARVVASPRASHVANARWERTTRA